MGYGRRWVLGWSLAGALVLSPVLAWAWSQGAMIDVRVHEHVFDRVHVESTECSIAAKLHFSAPEKGHYDSGARERDYHRFKARIKLTDGRTVESPVFGNPRPGRRVYTFDYDTRSDGCWAKEPHKLQGVDVEACRGRRCEPQPFR